MAVGDDSWVRVTYLPSAGSVVSLPSLLHDGSQGDNQRSPPPRHAIYGYMLITRILCSQLRTPLEITHKALPSRP